MKNKRERAVANLERATEAKTVVGSTNYLLASLAWSMIRIGDALYERADD